VGGAAVQGPSHSLLLLEQQPLQGWHIQLYGHVCQPGGLVLQQQGWQDDRLL
jgi:hypothetical protein